jgi:hypothetical protein
MHLAKQGRKKVAPIGASAARKRPEGLLQGQDLRRALEELRDTKNDARAQELKRVIADSICGE